MSEFLDGWWRFWNTYLLSWPTVLGFMAAILVVDLLADLVWAILKFAVRWALERWAF